LDIGDKFLEKFEEHFGRGKTKLLVGLFGGAVIAGSIVLILGVLVKIISYSVFDVIIPMIDFLQNVDFNRITHIRSKLLSDIVVAVSASSASAFIIWAVSSTMVWSLIQNVRLWLDKRDLQKRMTSIRGTFKEVKTGLGEIHQANQEFYAKLGNDFDDLQSEIREQTVKHEAALEIIRDQEKEIAALKALLTTEKPAPLDISADFPTLKKLDEA